MLDKRRKDHEAKKAAAAAAAAAEGDVQQNTSSPDVETPGNYWNFILLYFMTIISSYKHLQLLDWLYLCHVYVENDRCCSGARKHEFIAIAVVLRNLSGIFVTCRDALTLSTCQLLPNKTGSNYVHSFS